MSETVEKRNTKEFCRAVLVGLLALIFVVGARDKFLFAQWATSGNDIYNSNAGNVGIGTTAPNDARTHIRTSGSNPLKLQSTGATANLLFNTSNGQGEIISETSGSTYGIRLNFPTVNLSGDLFVDSGGNVGIGTTTPGAKVEVANGTFRLKDSTNGKIWDFVVGSPTSNIFRFTYGLGQTTAIAINESNGRVGIGTTSPATVLHVMGDAKFESGVSEALTVKSITSAVNLIFQTSAGQSGEFTANANGLQFNAPLAGNDIYFRTQGTNPVVFKSGGNVGIGTTLPAQRLDVAGVIQTSAGLYLGSASRQVGVSGSDLWVTTGSAERVRITGDGRVGIATAAPDASSKLHVAGAARIDGMLTAGTFVARYQDLAEWVPAARPLAAGTVVVLDPERSNHVQPSRHAYDATVAGAISAAPGILLGEGGDDRVKVATTGRVKVKVDATVAPIRIGDLLVTSDKEGVAMRSEPVELAGVRMHRPGTLLGKALEPLADGEGEILVLLSLQ